MYFLICSYVYDDVRNFENCKFMEKNKNLNTSERNTIFNFSKKNSLIVT